MTKLSVSLGQMRITLGRVEDNLRAAEGLVRQAAAQDSRLLVLPELWSTGYDLENAREHAAALGEGVFVRLAALAREHGIALYGSILERRGEQVLNCATYFDAEGELRGVYRKLHLFRLFDEHLWLGEGDAPTACDAGWGTCGLSVCYDLRFPELFRRYAVADGVKAVLVCAEWPLARVAHWRALLMARAIENQCHVIAVNSCGETGGAVFGGHSMIIDPWGIVVAEAGEDEALVTAEIDLALVERARAKIPVFADRRPDVYL